MFFGLSHFVYVDVILKTGCEISTFLKFKDWIENTTFIIQDETGDVSHSIHSVVILDRQAGMMDWPGSYKGCQNCKTTHTASNFGNEHWHYNCSY